MGRSFRTIDSNPVTYVSYAGLQFLVN